MNESSNSKRRPVALEGLILPSARPGVDVMLAVVAWSVPIVLLLALYYPPPLLSQGQAHRIFYIHVPTAWIALYAPIFSAVAGLLFLFKRDEVFDVWSLVNARLALGFSIAVLISGPIWANIEWGTPWNWKDARLVSFFILGLALGGYFLVRTLTENPSSRAVYGAVMAVLSAVAALLTWFSIRLITPDTHPTSVMGTMSPKIRLTFWVSVLGFHMLFWIFLRLGLRQEYLNRGLARLRALRDHAPVSGSTGSVGTPTAILLVLLLGVAVGTPTGLGAQEPEYGKTPQATGDPIDLSRARELLQMDGLAAKESIEDLSEQDAKELVTQVLYVARAKSPEIDRAFLLVQHLEAIRATALAQRRLDSLLWVLGLTLALFGVFLVYVLFDQRRTIREMRTLVSTAAPGETSRSDSSAQVYRGE